MLRSGWLTTGPRVKQFEQKMAAFVGARHALAVNSCTAAMHLALEAIGLRRGDAVLVPTMTFAATAEVVPYSDRVRAVMPVARGAASWWMSRACSDWRSGTGCALVEDAAHALPSEQAGRRCGSTGDAVCISFHANKTMSTGEGGKVVNGTCRFTSGWRRCRSAGRYGEGRVEALQQRWVVVLRGGILARAPLGGHSRSGRGRLEPGYPKSSLWEPRRTRSSVVASGLS